MAVPTICLSQKKKGEILRSFTENYRFAVIENSSMAREAQRRHKLPTDVALLLGQLMAGASLLSSFLRGEERILLDIRSQGYVKRLFSEAIQVGENRGFAHINEDASLPLFLGGEFSSTKVLYNNAKPLTSVTSLLPPSQHSSRKNNLTENMQLHLDTAYQMPMVVRLASSADEKGEITYCGGVLMDVLPGDTSKPEVERERLQRLVEEARDNLFKEPSLASLFEQVPSWDLFIESLIKEPYQMEEKLSSKLPVDFYCRCSRKMVLLQLASLGKSEIESMEKDGHNTTECQYCAEKYTVSPEEFDLLKQHTQ